MRCWSSSSEGNTRSHFWRSGLMALRIFLAIYIYIYCFSKQRIEVARNHPLFLLLACFVIFFFLDAPSRPCDRFNECRGHAVNSSIFESEARLLWQFGPFPQSLDQSWKHWSSMNQLVITIRTIAVIATIVIYN